MEPAPGGPIKITQAMNIKVISLSLVGLLPRFPAVFRFKGFLPVFF